MTESAAEEAQRAFVGGYVGIDSKGAVEKAQRAFVSGYVFR